ncbi:hypothetical protein ACLOJK_016582 [Asimina triloba]
MALAALLPKLTHTISALRNSSRRPVFVVFPPAVVSFKCSMAEKTSIRIAAAQMTSVNDLSVNFDTCSRLVKASPPHPTQAPPPSSSDQASLKFITISNDDML